MIKAHVFRLTPGQDLKQEIQKYANEKNIEAGWISTCVGSLTGYMIRFANQSVNTKQDGHFEIISLAGTVSKNGSHLHICVSDKTGKTIGGHLSDGCIVFTTAEVVLMSTDEFAFIRAEDEWSGYKELMILKSQGNV